MTRFAIKDAQAKMAGMAKSERISFSLRKSAWTQLVAEMNCDFLSTQTQGPAQK